MCRCNSQIKAPYCNKCDQLIPRMGVSNKVAKLFDILKDGWVVGDEESTLREAIEKGYIVNMGEIEIAFLIFDTQADINMGAQDGNKY